MKYISRLFLITLVFAFCCETATVGNCYARGVLSRSVSKAIARKSTEEAARKQTAKKVEQNAYQLVLRRDALRDHATKASPLQKDTFVRRYTNWKQALHEKRSGIRPNTHMTPPVAKGRPISKETAQKRYGLKNIPTARMTIQVPKGQPVRKNKVIGGDPGRGEWTSPTPLSGHQVIKIEKLE